jgi:hypothetical protein
LHQLSGDERYSLPRVLNGRRIPKIDCANAPISACAAGNVFDFDRDNILTPWPVLDLCKGDALQNMPGNAFLDHDITPNSNYPPGLLLPSASPKTTVKHLRSSRKPGRYPAPPSVSHDRHHRHLFKAWTEIVIRLYQGQDIDLATRNGTGPQALPKLWFPQ